MSDEKTPIRQGFLATLSGAFSSARTPDPVAAERARLRRERPQTWATVGQFVKTALALFAWFLVSPVHVQVISPYATYVGAQAMLNALAISAAVLLHLWPPRTPPWRTLFWLLCLTGVTGSTLLMLGAGTVSLTGATIVGFGFVALRVNQNGRKLVQLIRDWRRLG